ncbi:MAG: hypothetical protein NCW75_03385 [Phycisphaera sp.]|nr:MAG: hypothetical protein NCW75_03385 [Phycisphaera sp.]
MIKLRLRSDLNDDEIAAAVVEYKRLHRKPSGTGRASKSGQHFYDKWARPPRGESERTQRQATLEDLEKDMRLLGIDTWIGWANMGSFHAHRLLSRLIGKLGAVSGAHANAGPRERLRGAFLAFSEEVRTGLDLRQSELNSIAPQGADDHGECTIEGASGQAPFVDNDLACELLDVAYVWNAAARRFELLYSRGLRHPAVVDGIRSLSSAVGRVARPTSEQNKGLVFEIDLDFPSMSPAEMEGEQQIFENRTWPYSRTRMPFAAREEIHRTFVFRTSWVCPDRQLQEAQLFLSFRVKECDDDLLDQLKLDLEPAAKYLAGWIQYEALGCDESRPPLVPQNARRHVFRNIREALTAKHLDNAATALAGAFSQLVPFDDGEYSVSVHWVLPVVQSSMIFAANDHADENSEVPESGETGDNDIAEFTPPPALGGIPRARPGSVWIDPTSKEVCFCTDGTEHGVHRELADIVWLSALSDSRYVVQFQSGSHIPPAANEPKYENVAADEAQQELIEECRPLKSMIPVDSGLVGSGLSVQAAAWGSAIFYPDLRTAQEASDPLASLSEVCRYDDEVRWPTGWELAMPIRRLAPPDMPRTTGLPSLAVVDVEAKNADIATDAAREDDAFLLSIDAAARLYSAFDYFRSSPSRSEVLWERTWKFCLGLLGTERVVTTRSAVFTELTKWLVESSGLKNLTCATVLCSEANTGPRRVWHLSERLVTDDTSRDAWRVRLGDWQERGISSSIIAEQAARGRVAVYCTDCEVGLLAQKSDFPEELAIRSVYAQPIISHMQLDLHGVLLLGWPGQSPEQEMLQDLLSRLCYVIGSIDAIVTE